MENQIILAPLQGYTDAVFRDIYAKYFSGIDQAIAPFISTMGQQRLKPSRIQDVLPENNEQMNVIPQILGNVAQDFIFLATHFTKFGYDIVNWNMGCPHSKIANKKRGSGMLPWPELIDELLNEIFETIPCKLSIKVRLGRTDKNEIFNILPIFNKYPLEEIIVHPRTGVQMYEGTSDIDAFSKVVDNTYHKIVYNGDIKYKQDFDIIQSRFPQIKRFMIGRGVLSNPFLPSEIKGEERDKAHDLDKIKIFHDELFETYSKKFYGPSHVAGRMKGFWSYIGPSFNRDHKVFKKIFKSKNKDHYKAETEVFFSQKPIFFPQPFSIAVNNPYLKR